MTIKSSGPWCDVCGSPILPGYNKSINPFGCKGTKQTLHACDTCRELVLGAEKDWKKLPNGPLKKAFEDREKSAVREGGK